MSATRCTDGGGGGKGKGKAKGTPASASASALTSSPLKKAPMSRSERASAQPVELETLKRWIAGGLLEGAVAKVLQRASTVGKSIRGSSLVMQVEQALGVGSGALRSHGNQIQTMSKSLSTKGEQRGALGQ